MSNRTINSSNSPNADLLNKDDERWMRYALDLAEKARAINEVPVGAVIVKDGLILGEGYNSPIQDHDPSAHAEMRAIQMASTYVGNYRLVDASLYVTLEPCPMCAGAIVHARVKRVIFGAYDLKTGAGGSAMQLLRHEKLNHQCQITGGVLQSACAHSVSSFFAQRRLQIKAARAAARLKG